MTPELTTFPFKPKSLTLTLEEARAITNCPFSNNNASEQNYPGYNAAMKKIFDFVKEHEYDSPRP